MLKQKNRNNEDMFKIIEVYYDQDGNIESWCDCADSILIWDTLDNLKGTIPMLMKAIEKPLLKEVSFEKIIEEIE